MSKTRREIQVNSGLMKIIKSIREEYNIETDSGAICKALDLYKNELIPLKQDFNSLQDSYLNLSGQLSQQTEVIDEFSKGIAYFFKVSKTKIPK